MARYTIDGIEYPSPTEVLSLLEKPALKQWAVNMAIKYIKESDLTDLTFFNDVLEKAKYEWKNQSEEAKDIGSEIHAIIENWIKEDRDAMGKYRPEVENGFLAFLDWEKNNIIEWLFSEMVVVSQDYGFAGQLDAVALMHDKGEELVRVIDFKSSKGFYDGYKKQVSLYLCALQEMVRKRIRVVREEGQLITKPHYWGLPKSMGTGVLRLDKLTGEPEFRAYDKFIDRKTEAALLLLDYYYKDKKRRLKNQRRAA